MKSIKQTYLPFLFPIGRFVLSKDANELCFDNWALAASALFHSALMSMDAKYKVCKQKQTVEVQQKTEFIISVIPCMTI